MSLCLGAFVLASAGLLDGRRATTHWRHCQTLADAYPQVEVVPDVLYIDEGDVLTSGGVAAGIDLCLHVARGDYGAEIANQLARALVVGPHREGGQAQFVEQPVSCDGDGRLGLALSWALEHLHEDITIEQFARTVAMSRRTFYREFTASIGTTPRRWLVECGLATVEAVDAEFHCARGVARLRVSVERGTALARGPAVPEHMRWLSAGDSLELAEDEAKIE